MRKPRPDILLVSGSFYPREGGAERQMRLVLATLSSRGYRCVVITQAIASAPRRDRVDGCDVIRVGSTYMFQVAPRLGALWFCIRACAETLRRRPRSIVSLMLGAQTVAAALAARALAAPHVVRLTGGGTGSARSEPVAKSRSFLGRSVVRLILRQRPRVVAPAGHLLEDMKCYFPEADTSFGIVPNAVPLSRAMASQQQYREGIAWYSRRGTDKYVEDFRRLATLLPDLRIHTFGQVHGLEGPPNVTEHGWLWDPMELLGRCRVLVNTSKYEGSPNVVLQALAVGCNVVAYDNPGMRELSDRYPDGVTLAPYGDVAKLAELAEVAHKKENRVQAIPSAVDVTTEWVHLLHLERK